MEKKLKLPGTTLVLLSGGLDSAVNLAMALDRGIASSALTVHYGQRSAERELSAAEALARHYLILHEVITLPWFDEYCGSALSRPNVDLPHLSQGDLDSPALTKESARAVWVPNRNGLLMNIAAAIAEARGIESILVGFNAEEGATFPDNTAECLEAINQAFSYTTLGRVQVICFTTGMTKSEMVKAGRELHLPFELLWSCYEGSKTQCGRCESCLRFSRALESL